MDKSRPLIYASIGTAAVLLISLYYWRTRRASVATGASIVSEASTPLPPPIAAAFDDAVANLRTSTVKPRQEQQLELYALYKISRGEYGGKGEGGFSLDPVRAAKDRALARAWADVAGNRTLAARRYVELAKQVMAVEEGEGGGDDEASGFGVVTSQLSAPLVVDEPGATPILGDPETVAAALAAASEDDVSALKRLAATTSLVNLADSHGVTPLMMAADRGSLGALRLLLSLSVPLTAVDADGATALHYAALCDRLEVVQVLLQAGADPGATDDDGDTPADVTDSADCAEALRKQLH
jgi:acyl-CoA-binding protein